MKKVYVALVDVGIKLSPGEDTPLFPLYLADIPNVGDYLFFDDAEDYADDEWFTDLVAFCEEKFIKKTAGFEFKIMRRTLIRSLKESWYKLDLIYVPGIYDYINTKKSK